MYRFFVQPQLNAFTRSLVGYEMLIREYDGSSWRLPQNFASIPINQQIHLLHLLSQELLLKVGSLSFNLTREQFVNQQMEQALIKTQQTIFPLKLVLELTEEPTAKNLSADQIRTQIERYSVHGIEISVDDVSTGLNRYQKIKSFLPLVHEIKLPLQNLRQEQRQKDILSLLLFWKKIAAQYRLRLIVEGVEDMNDVSLLDALDLPLRQGYYMGKPHLYRLPGDPVLN